MDDTVRVRRELQAAGRYLLANELAWGNAGNLSARTSADRLLVTASGTRLGELGDDDFVECPVDADETVSYPRKPSKEMPMHRAIYAARPEISAVLHAAPFYSTLVACAENVSIPGDLYVENMYYQERVARVPYRHPGSQALGDAVAAQATNANVLLLENHGVLVYDTSVSEALMGLHTLELTCRMIITARSAGLSLKPLPPETVRDFLTHSGYRPPRTWSEGSES
ncbi:MAG: class II aldolase/adducin family protein [Anaerolineae bacterium]|nr:class II aldolase/adducin family protein [Anaerolineae bacterium]